MVRGLGLLFKLPDGEEWRTAMINTAVFAVNTPQAFYDRLFATQPDPKTGKPDPEKMAAFLASHPETVQATKIIQSHPASSGFENSTFYGLNAFWFTDASGRSTPVRWSMAPEQPFAPANTAAAQGDKNYLFDALIASILQHPLQWRLIITIGQPNDPTNDATIPWPDTREQVDVGTLTLDHVESEDDRAPAATLISIRWFCRKEWRRPMILCLALVQRSIPSRSPDAQARRSYRARSRLPRCESEHERGHRAAAIHSSHAVVSLAHRRDGADHARHWCCDGGVARRLSSFGVHSPAVGYSHTDCGGDSLHQPSLLHSAAVSRHDVASRALGCLGV